MFYCKVNKKDSENITAKKLFGKVAAQVGLERDYDSAILNPIRISQGGKVEETGGTVYLQEKECAKDKDAVVLAGLCSCAAVLFYSNDGGNYNMIGAYHASGGAIEDGILAQFGEANAAIYATPCLPRSDDPDHKGYKDYKGEIDKLARKYGTENVCIIDGFNDAVVANRIGELKLISK